MDPWLTALDRLYPTPVDREWHHQARPEQLPPEGDWNVWLLMAGRGFGKSRAGAEWLAEQALTTPGVNFAVVAPTIDACRAVCIEGPSGLLAALGMTRDDPGYNIATGTIRLGNGATIQSYTAERPDRLRGPNLAGAWCDEIGSWPYDATWYEALVPAVRIGTNPRIVATTTPRRTKLVRDLAGRGDGSVAVTRGSTYDNAANLSSVALGELRRRYEGTRLGRQELHGELIEDVEGALWTAGVIDTNRVAEPPPMVRVVVAVDPAVTSGEDSDETGIVAVGKTTTGDLYVLADRTCRAAPVEWARTAVALYDAVGADRVIGEANNGGDMIEAVIRSVRPGVPYRKVTATRGKLTRAEPVSALYEQGRVHHVGVLPELEDQLTTWVPGEKSPDRLDALVWACTELGGVSSALTFLHQLEAEKTAPSPTPAGLPQFGQPANQPAAC